MGATVASRGTRPGGGVTSEIPQNGLKSSAVIGRSGNPNFQSARHEVAGCGVNCIRKYACATDVYVDADVCVCEFVYAQVYAEDPSNRREKEGGHYARPIFDSIPACISSVGKGSAKN